MHQSTALVTSREQIWYIATYKTSVPESLEIENLESPEELKTERTKELENLEMAKIEKLEKKKSRKR